MINFLTKNGAIEMTQMVVCLQMKLSKQWTLDSSLLIK
jgi:hypothetical protein